MTIGIGVYAQGDPDRLRATLASLSRHAARAAVVVLADESDAATAGALAALSVERLVCGGPHGRAAAFNRLISAVQTDVVMFLESGAVIGPGALDRLDRALSDHPGVALAGPSTNRAWNEQRLAGAPEDGASPEQIDAFAAAVAARAGDAVATLEPLYSLSDFAYAVKRAVIDRIGGADEGYGSGPCWEMDYNIRAARAGFRGVWVRGAYVHRAPLSPRHRRDEAAGLESSKRRYQDKFCALRRREPNRPYEAHCRGDACEHFAPAASIALGLPVPSRSSAAAPAPAAARRGPTSSALVSCIMPTRDRPRFVAQSVAYFQRQDYPERELIILDDGAVDCSGVLPRDSRVRYVRIPAASIGTKRNRACEMARGQYIVQWDDDDWFGPRRLSAQLAPLLAGRAEITGLTAHVFLDLAGWRFWTCTPELHRQLFVGDVHGGTLAFHRRVWKQLARYPDSSLAEDAAFLGQALRGGARLQKIAEPGLFIYLRHGGNAWQFACGQHVAESGWRQIAEPPLPPADRDFYTSLAGAPPLPAPSGAAATSIRAEVAEAGGPLVSCIMPTANRRAFVPRAIAQFLQQDYPDRELIIVDDGADRVRDLVPDDPRVRYVGLDGVQPLGAKRNLACRLARGEIVAHWDDDDWMASWRLTYQVRALRERRADVCGLDTIFFCDLGAGRAWRYVYPAGGAPWLAGGTLCYTTAFWRANPFPAVNEGEDSRFLWSARSKTLHRLDDPSFYVAFIHPGNTSGKRTSDPRYQPWDFAAVQRLMESGAPRAPAGAPSLPLISCIMPTRNRRRFVGQAVRYFSRQDYPNTELIVVHDGEEPVADLLPAEGRVRLVALPRLASLGEKRNIAVRESRGDIVAHWDDDDWYHPQYLSRLAERLLAAGDRDAVAGIGTYLVHILGEPCVRVCRTGGVVGATIGYFRSLWTRHPYRDVATAEDFFLLQDARPALAPLADPELFIVIRHGRHTWTAERGLDVTEQLRRLAPYRKRLDQLVAPDDARFYREARPAT